MKTYTRLNINKIPAWDKLSPMQKQEIKIVSMVLPFRVNNHTLDLIDWSNIPSDPIYQLVFPNREMLRSEDYQLLIKHPDSKTNSELIARIRSSLNPHPDGQMALNRPVNDSGVLKGIQHKYHDTALYFPAKGQTCHSYCSFCFRWAQFVNDKSLRFSSNKNEEIIQYLKNNTAIKNIVFTGGDPMVMNANALKALIEPLLDIEHLSSIRIGSKSLTYWPQRYISDKDTPQVLRLFEKVIEKGKQLAFMAHINHSREIDNPIAKQAIKNIQSTGALIRSQAPILKHINDSSEIWKNKMELEERLGIIPYYMFVERQTGASRYFEMSLAEAYRIYKKAISQVAGLSRTMRGPVMSSEQGKVEVLGITKAKGKPAFHLRFLRHRNPDMTYQPFLAAFEEKSTWFDQLLPIGIEDKRYLFGMSNSGAASYSTSGIAFENTEEEFS